MIVRMACALLFVGSLVFGVMAVSMTIRVESAQEEMATLPPPTGDIDEVDTLWEEVWFCAAASALAFILGIAGWPRADGTGSLR